MSLHGLTLIQAQPGAEHRVSAMDPLPDRELRPLFSLPSSSSQENFRRSAPSFCLIVFRLHIQSVVPPHLVHSRFPGFVLPPCRFEAVSPDLAVHPRAFGPPVEAQAFQEDSGNPIREPSPTNLNPITPPEPHQGRLPAVPPSPRLSPIDRPPAFVIKVPFAPGRTGRANSSPRGPLLDRPELIAFRSPFVQTQFAYSWSVSEGVVRCKRTKKLFVLRQIEHVPEVRHLILFIATAAVHSPHPPRCRPCLPLRSAQGPEDLEHIGLCPDLLLGVLHLRITNHNCKVSHILLTDIQLEAQPNGDCRAGVPGADTALDPPVPLHPVQSPGNAPTSTTVYLLWENSGSVVPPESLTHHTGSHLRWKRAWSFQLAVLLAWFDDRGQEPSNILDAQIFTECAYVPGLRSYVGQPSPTEPCLEAESLLAPVPNSAVQLSTLLTKIGITHIPGVRYSS